MDSYYLALVNERAKYGPNPPPIIIRPYEAGNPTDYFSMSPIIWNRRAAPYELPSGNPKSYGEELGLNIDIRKYIYEFFPTVQNASLVKFLDQGNIPALSAWIQVYLLKPPGKNFDLASGLLYLAKIDDDNTGYPNNLLEKVAKVIDEEFSSNQGNLSQIILNSGLNIYMPSSADIDFFLTSIYWNRSFRIDRKRLENILPSLNLIDLYFITSNPLERYAARKLLSYYTDEELYKQFGRLGNYLFPKNYPSKKIQLDAFVAFSLYRFGYFTVENWTTPIQLTYNLPFRIVPSKEEIGQESFSLNNLISQLQNNLLDSKLLMPLFRLAIQIYSSWPQVRDQANWEKFLFAVEKYRESFNSILSSYRTYPFQLETERSVNEKTTVKIPPNFQSLEQTYNICLLCEQTRSSEYFELCGHGVCMSCQALLGTSQCPFCTEHFVAEAIDNSYVSTIMQMIPTIESFQQKIIDISKQKKERVYRFDWSSGDVQLIK